MRGHGDSGAATSILVIGMALPRVVVTLIFGPIARANDLRTRAQPAADASAQAVRKYAAENGATVDDVHPSGFFGCTVRGPLQAQVCESSPSPGRAPTHYWRDPRERSRHGNATADAPVIFPPCEVRIFNDGKRHGPRYVPPIIGIPLTAAKCTTARPRTFSSRSAWSTRRARRPPTPTWI